MVIEQGSVTDRPWGVTLGDLGSRGLTGELCVASGGKSYRVGFDRGAIVAAASPLASDAVIRVAMTSHLISKLQVGALTRALAAAPDRDEVETVAEAAKLSRQHVDTLRLRLLAQRAARTFSLEQGEVTVDDQLTLRSVPGIDVDVRAVIFLGARTLLTEQRMAAALRAFGNHFTLRPDADVTVPRYGFTTAEQPILAALRRGTSLPELEAAHRELDPRTVQAVIYALMSCGACIAQDRPSIPRVSTAPVVARSLSTTDIPLIRASSGSEAAPYGPFVARTSTREPAPARPGSGPSVARASTGPRSAASTGAPASERPRPSTGSPAISRTSTARRTQALIAARMNLVEQGADYFTLLGVPFDAPAEVVRTAYLSLARALHPEKVAELGVDDPTRTAHRLFSHIGTAFTVLTDPVRRADYLARHQAMPAHAAATAPASPAATEIPMPRTRTTEENPAASPAAEAFRRGESALRRDQPQEAVLELTRACELAPLDVDYGAMLGWALFCAADDKTAVVPKTRLALEKAIQRSSKPLGARFLLGRVERMLGRDREALHHFHIVIDEEPGHAEAASEIRVIEARLSAASSRKR